VPKLAAVEPLREEARDFIEAIVTARPPRSDVVSGRNVVAALQAASLSLKKTRVVSDSTKSFPVPLHDSVVIPLRNEEQNVPPLAQKLTAALGALNREMRCYSSTTAAPMPPAHGCARPAQPIPASRPSISPPLRPDGGHASGF